MEESRPRVILSAAVSIDGRIATRTGDSALSSAADLKRLHRLRSRCDAILVGANTVLCDDPMLTVRSGAGKSPVRVVLDSRAAIPHASQIMRTCGMVRTIIAVSRMAQEERLERLRRLGAETITAGAGSVDVRRLLQALRRRGIRSVLVEGGGTTNWEFVRRGLFDELIVTVSPYLVGGWDAVPLAAGAGFRRVSDSPKLSLRSARRLENHLVLHYDKL